MELSPVLTYAQGSDSREQVQSTFQKLESICAITTNDTCGFHVHFARINGWTIELLKPLCRAILFFEPAFEAILPSHRRGNEYAKSNRYDNSNSEGKTGRQMFQAISRCNNNVEVAELMNNGGDRYFGWNFLNLYYGRIQTVEFRHGPSVTNAQECIGWMELVVRFSKASVGTGEAEPVQQAQDVAGLWRFLGASTGPGVAAMRKIFQGKSGMITPRRVRTLTPADRAKLESKKAQAEARNLLAMKMTSTFK